MTSREIVQAAIRHQATERVPYRIELCGDAWEAIRGRVGAADQEEFLRNDVLAISPPWWNWYGLGPDWAGMDAPQTRATVGGTGDYTAFTETVKKWRGETDKYILVTIYGSHFEKAYFSRGIENFLADLGSEPEFARGLCHRIIEKNLVMLDNFLPLPEIDGVLLGSDWGSQLDLLMAPELWHDLLAPGEQQEYDLVHAYGKDVWVHSCGNIERIIPSLVAMGLDVLNPVQPECMDLARLKARHGDRLAFWGGISTQRTLPYGTPDEVRREARRVRDLMARGGGYILSPSQQLQNDVPLENILALLDVARERAGGPGEGSPSA